LGIYRILLKRFAEAEDPALAFVFLAADKSNYITGQFLCVGGKANKLLTIMRAGE
jgi:NAD(P)-dependent dehydrogenase (short-subunit alcohol dehydrogenase family)